jgi:hypothetical protein
LGFEPPGTNPTFFDFSIFILYNEGMREAAKPIGVEYAKTRLAGCRQRSLDRRVWLVWYGAHTGYHNRDGLDDSPGTLLVRVGETCYEMRFYKRVVSNQIPLAKFAGAWAASAPGPIDPHLIQRALAWGLLG